MRRNLIIAALLVATCASGPLARGERERNGGTKANKQSPGGAWSERSHQGGEGHKSYTQPNTETGKNEEKSEEERNRAESERNVTPNSAFTRRGEPGESNSHEAAAGVAFEKHSQPNYSGAQGAAAGAAAVNRNQPQHSGAQDAAAGAAAANRRGPQYSGAEGAAAGAAVENRNQPKYSGAEGAAAGAAVANRNQQQSLATGIAAGAAAANSNQSTLSPAQGAALGTAAANLSSASPGVPPGANSPAAVTQALASAGAQPIAAAGSGAVKNAFSNYGLYSPQWATEHSEAWAPTHVVGGSLWSPTNWNSVAVYAGAHGQPVWYDYGENVVYQNGNIVMAGQTLGTAEEFSQQAGEIADAGFDAKPPADTDWMPLGVFAMVRDEQQHPQMILQLAMNKQGLLRGNFTDEVTEHTQAVRGGYDLRTKRAAWIVGDHKTAVMEAGLGNLAEGDAPALIHKNGKTDHWLLVRLQQPPAGAAPGPN